MGNKPLLSLGEFADRETEQRQSTQSARGAQFVLSSAAAPLCNLLVLLLGSAVFCSLSCGRRPQWRVRTACLTAMAAVCAPAAPCPLFSAEKPVVLQRIIAAVTSTKPPSRSSMARQSCCLRLQASAAMLLLAIVASSALVAVAAQTADTQSSPVSSLSASDDPIQWSFFGFGSGSCIGTPAAQYAPVSGVCLDSVVDNMSILANCSTDGALITFRSYRSLGCDPSMLWQQAHGPATSDSCIAVWDFQSPRTFQGSAQGVCPLPGLKSTVSVQDLRSTTFVPDTPLLIPFSLSTVDPEVNGSYALITKDINEDGKPDLVSVPAGGGSVIWYENLGVPDDAPLSAVRWKPHLIAQLKGPIYASFADFDSDGVLDIVVATQFNVPPTNNSLTEGLLYWFRQNSADSWSEYYIGQVQGAHRVQTGDFNNDGHGELIAIPLFSEGAPPLYGAAHITVFEPLQLDPYKPWNATIINSDFNVIHNGVAVNKPKGVGGQNLLISCQQGLVLLDVFRSAVGWGSTPSVLYAANFSDPSDGARILPSDPMRFYHGVTAFDYARTPPFYVGAIDYRPDSYLDDPSQPWHGDTVVVYTHPDRLDTSTDELFTPGLKRTVLYLGRTGGQSVKLVDIDRDGCTDMLVGYRGVYGRRVLLLQVQSHNSSESFPSCGDGVGKVPPFTQQVLSERGTSMIAVNDFDGDGYPDFATVGWGQAGDTAITLFASRYAAWILSSPGGLPDEPDCAASASKLAWQFACFICAGAAGLFLAAALWQWSRVRKFTGSLDAYPTGGPERKRSERNMLAGSPDTLRMRMLK